MTTSEDESGVEQEHDVSDDDSESSTEPTCHYSESEMGERNGPFTKADLYFAAKYIASISDWATMTSNDRWEPFHARYPQRSAKAWGEYHRRFEKRVSKLAKRIRRENSSSIMSQLGHPSKVPPKSKRRLDDEPMEDELELTPKRTKIDSSE